MKNRIEAIRFLRHQGVPVVLRIDPLFPRDSLPDDKTMSDFGLPDVQPLSDLEELVRFAKDVGVLHIVYSIAKITRPRFGEIAPEMSKMRQVYEHLACGQSLTFRGGSWRLPQEVAEQFVASPFLDLCNQYEIEAKVCKSNLISTP